MPALSRLLRLARELTIELLRPGESGVTGRELWSITRLAVTLAIVLTNVIGSIAVLVIAIVVVPNPALKDVGHVTLVNLVIAALYIAGALVVGVIVGTRGLLRLKAWLVEDGEPTREVTRRVLRAPMLLFGVQVALWLGAAVLFGVLNFTYSSRLGIRVFVVVATTGLVTASCAYLITEVVLRPLAARALAGGAPEKLIVPGVATRSVLGWLLGTGLQLFGMVAIGILALVHDGSLVNHPRHGVTQLGIAMVVLGGTGVFAGLLTAVLVARTTADPLDSVRRALGEVQRGELDVQVPVYDGTQIGQLQLGFNEMVNGLRERERIREAFGTYVDPAVAARVLEEGTSLDGELVEVTVMFIDIRNFTGFAERTSADQVVAAINELFAQFVPIIHEHGGRVDKFVGDGLMAVFGAPRRLPNHADAALGAALAIADRVVSSGGLSFGVGLNSGPVVAGNIGGAGRFEFGVIGDPVNTAARVEAATRQTGDVILLAQRTAELLGGAHPELVERSGVHLKGKSEEIRLYAPASAAGAATTT